MNIVLCGMPCSGKSVVGSELSKKTKRIVIDTDREIARRYGKISEIFEKFGEKRFRELERQVVAEAAGNVNVVISTGGGCVLDPANVETLKKTGRIFYIDVPVEVLCQRAEGDTVRPLLSGDPVGKMTALYGERNGMYTAAADVVIDAGDRGAEEIAKEIIAKM